MRGHNGTSTGLLSETPATCPGPSVGKELEGRLLSSSHWAQQTLMICAPTVCQASARPAWRGRCLVGEQTPHSPQASGVWAR